MAARSTSPGAAIFGFAALVAYTAALGGCVYSSDPRVQAAEDFRSTVFDLIGKDEAQTRRLNSLRLGMTDQEVLAAAGAPTRRESRTTDGGRSIETWTYNGELVMVGTLAFENGRLTQVSTSGNPPPPTSNAD